MSVGEIKDADSVRRAVKEFDELGTARKIDLPVREKLDAFKGRDLSRPWSWFIQSTGRLSAHDFEVLTQ